MAQAFDDRPMAENGLMQRRQQVTCSECGRSHPEGDTRVIDEAPVCTDCLYGKTQPVQIYPIGFVANSQERDGSEFCLRGRAETSRVQLLPSQRRFMYKLEEEDRLTIVYHLHQARAVRSRFERGLDGKEVGVFASRTPDRLSRIGISEVRLVAVDGTTLVVEGLDAVDGTPVLDVKVSQPPE